MFSPSFLSLLRRLFENQLSELIKASAPSLPFMSSFRRNVRVCIDADFLQVLCCLIHTHVLFSTTAHEEHLVGLLKVSSILQLFCIESATTKHAHIRKRGRVSQRDRACLHSTHREACHSTMLCVSNHTVVLLHHWDDVFQQHILKCTSKIKSAKSPARTALSLSWTSLSTRSCLPLSIILSLWLSLSLSLSRCSVGTLHSLSCSTLTCRTGIQTIVHHDDERNSFACSNQIVHDDASLSLCRPASLILAHTMLEIEYRELLVRILVLSGWQVDVAVAHLTCH